MMIIYKTGFVRPSVQRTILIVFTLIYIKKYVESTNQVTIVANCYMYHTKSHGKIGKTIAYKMIQE